MITILFSGQSNCVGNGDGGAWDIDPLVTAWNCGDNLIDLTELGDAWVAPVRSENPFRDTGSNNQGLHAANYLAKITGQPVRLFVIGRTGQSINQWHNGTSTGAMYDRILAVLNAAGVTSVDWFLWNQGSADNGNASLYTAKWDAFIAQLTADGVIGASTPIVVSETAPIYSPDINPVLHAIAAADPRCGIAKMGHLQTHDDVHFTGGSLVMAGWESICALAKTQSPFTDIVPTALPAGYVYCGGLGALSLANAAQVRIPFMPIYGDLSMVHANGNIIIQEPGIYRFSLSVQLPSKATKVQLRDADTGEWVATVIHSGSGEPSSGAAYSHGEIVLNLPAGARIKVTMVQSSGATQAISASHNLANNRMEVQRI